MIDTVLSAASSAHGALQYIGLIEDRIEKQLIALANSEFDAGVRALEQAARSDSERASLLREARARFNKAISLETGHRLAMSLLGLAFCHAGLGDRCNANVALLELVTLDPNKFVGYWASWFGNGPDPEFLAMQHAAREHLFAEYRYAVPIGDGVYDFRLLKS